MKNSYFIEQNIDFINKNGYSIYPSGCQIYKKIRNCEVLITDYTGNKILFERLVVVTVWIKDSSTDLMFFEKTHKGSFFQPKLKKMDRIILAEINKFGKQKLQ